MNQQIIDLFAGLTIKQATTIVKSALVEQKLIETRGNQTAAAKELGINRATLHKIAINKEGK